MTGAPRDRVQRLTRAPGPFARVGDLCLRPLREREDDYARISRWRSDPRVLEGYGGRDHPLDIWTVMARLGPKVRGESEVFPCMIERAGRAIGYLQVYPVRAPSDYGLAEDEAQDLFGVDLFVGEPDLWGQGLGPIVLRATLDWLFREQGARKVVIDPRVENERAVRAYEKTGFTRVRRLRAHALHEGRRRDVWLMAMDREAWEALPPAPGRVGEAR